LCFHVFSTAGFHRSNTALSDGGGTLNLKTAESATLLPWVFNISHVKLPYHTDMRIHTINNGAIMF
jgi:hypothetical protein